MSQGTTKSTILKSNTTIEIRIYVSTKLIAKQLHCYNNKQFTYKHNSSLNDNVIVYDI